MKLDNETLLGSYLAHIQSRVRELARLDFERSNHPDHDGSANLSPERVEMRELWDKLSEQLLELLGLPLRPFGELVQPGPFHVARDVRFGDRCLRWNFGKLKKMADRHRRENPEFTMLKSWDYEARKRRLPEDEEVDKEMRTKGYCLGRPGR